MMLRATSLCRMSHLHRKNVTTLVKYRHKQVKRQSRKEEFVPFTHREIVFAAKSVATVPIDIYTIPEQDDDPFLIATEEDFSLNVNQIEHFKQMIKHVQISRKDDPHDIPTYIYDKGFKSFQDHFFTTLVGTRDSASKILRAFQKAKERNEEHELMWKLFMRDVTERYEGAILNYTNKKDMSEYYVDLTKPHDWFPDTRQLNRKIVFHTGPTNSGKTHAAFTALKEAPRGVYAAPLRLLATEGYVKLTGMGLKCELMTGDYKIELDDATHTASTIEMLDTAREYDVAVIDEIQLISDPDRGWAWTRALLGVKAKEVHLCGEERATKLLEKICKDCNEDFEVIKYDRLTKLSVAPKTLKSLKQLEPGDCVVTFSRRDIFKLKAKIESETPYKVAVVYGGLPPLVRLQQAELFNSTSSTYDILVATDAIGHGLNLNIRRIIFHTMTKFDGTTIRNLEVNEIRQIGGRAGRYGSIYPNGIVTTFSQRDHVLLRSAFSSRPLPSIEMAGLFPTSEQLEKLAHRLNGVPLHEILGTVSSFNRIDQLRYFLCDVEDMIELAKILETVPELTMSDKIELLLTPVQTDDAVAMNIFRSYCVHYAQGKSTSFLVDIPTRVPRSIGQLQELESVYKILEMYCWLSYRYESVFNERESARQAQNLCMQLIEKGLSINYSSKTTKVRVPKRERRAKMKQKRIHILEDLRRFGIDDAEFEEDLRIIDYYNERQIN
jgi:ATP-dependent RNA helicase SUPV3L1/SUV3